MEWKATFGCVILCALVFATIIAKGSVIGLAVTGTALVLVVVVGMLTRARQMNRETNDAVRGYWQYVEQTQRIDELDRVQLNHWHRCRECGPIGAVCEEGIRIEEELQEALLVQ